MSDSIQPLADLNFIKQVTKVDQVRLEELIQDTSILLWEMYNAHHYRDMNDFDFLWFTQIIHKYVQTIHEFFYPGRDFLEHHVIKDDKNYVKFLRLMSYVPVELPNLAFDYDHQSYRRRQYVKSPPSPPF